MNRLTEYFVWAPTAWEPRSRFFLSFSSTEQPKFKCEDFDHTNSCAHKNPVANFVPPQFCNFVTLRKRNFLIDWQNKTLIAAEMLGTRFTPGKKAWNIWQRKEFALFGVKYFHFHSGGELRRAWNARPTSAASSIWRCKSFCFLTRLFKKR